jgi:hypothetical protein
LGRKKEEEQKNQLEGEIAKKEKKGGEFGWLLVSLSV